MRPRGALVVFEFEGPCNGTGLYHLKENLRDLWQHSETQMVEFSYSDDSEEQRFLLGRVDGEEEAKLQYVTREVENMIYNWGLEPESVRKLIQTLEKQAK